MWKTYSSLSRQKLAMAHGVHRNWDPKQANKMVTSYHGPAYSPKNEYGLGTKNMIASMTMSKRSDIGTPDSGESNYVTISDKGCRYKRNVTGLTHRIAGKPVLPKCELDMPCVHYDKDGNQVGEVTILDCSHCWRKSLGPVLTREFVLRSR